MSVIGTLSKRRIIDYYVFLDSVNLSVGKSMEQVTRISEQPGREMLVRRGKLLEYLTISYNGLEGLIAVISGLLAGSIALVSFGFDSLIEVSSGLALVWRLRSDLHEARRERVEAITLRIVGVCFMLLAVYILYDAGKSLLRHEEPEKSVIGIGLTIASITIMPLLTRAKRKVGKGINSAAMMADAKQTELCAYLSAITLGGLILNAILGWWWADPVAALIMVPIIAKEGVEALRGEACCNEGSCH
jgi:divalent metal cation (Fe/Co/Zn/Cd) transporter